jgi:hypothetical protein
MEWYWHGKKDLEKSCPSATLHITNLTWTDLGRNPGLQDERPATNRLRHVTAKE